VISYHTDCNKGSGPASNPPLNLQCPLCGKRKHSTSESLEHIADQPTTKRVKRSDNILGARHINVSVLQGTHWRENSCAYNATTAVLYAMWSANPDCLEKVRNGKMRSLAAKFLEHYESKCSLKDARDYLRDQLHTEAPNESYIPAHLPQ
jgi:hypothetical protein